jgi:hypothetical protein
MNDQGTVNGQILDSIASTVTIGTGMAPSQAFGMLDTVMVETLGMAMYNAVSRQQGGSMVGSAAVTAACAKMLGAPLVTAPKSHVLPPHIHHLPTPPAPPEPWNPPIPPAPPTPPVTDPSAIIQQQTQAAMAAIKSIHKQGETAATDEVLANKSLANISKAAVTAEVTIPAPPLHPPELPAESATRRPPRPKGRP